MSDLLSVPSRAVLVTSDVTSGFLARPSLQERARTLRERSSEAVLGIKLRGIELYTGPRVLGAPNDLDQVVRDFVSRARKSLLIAVQELDSRSLAEAILAAAASGVGAQVILEGDYLVESPPSDDPWIAGGANETNRAIHAAMLRAGIDVITDLNSARPASTTRCCAWSATPTGSAACSTAVRARRPGPRRRSCGTRASSCTRTSPGPVCARSTTS